MDVLEGSGGRALLENCATRFFSDRTSQLSGRLERHSPLQKLRKTSLKLPAGAGLS